MGYVQDLGLSCLGLPAFSFLRLLDFNSVSIAGIMALVFSYYHDLGAPFCGRQCYIILRLICCEPIDLF
jgi:hypothetical protein